LLRATSAAEEPEIPKVCVGAAFILISSAALALMSTGCERTGHAAQHTPVDAHTVSRVILGRSIEGRPIRAVELGDPAAPRRVLVVGCVHGSESAGEAVTRDLRSVAVPAGVLIWAVDRFNPDGCRAGTRQNARGVDLNRNSPWHWRRLGGEFYSGPRPLSEPESRAINSLVRCVQPQISVWYHQSAALVDDSGGNRPIERRYARIVGLPFRHIGLEPGSITSWQNAVFPRHTAFVVELPPGRLGATAARRHVSAVLALAQAIPARPQGPNRQACG
jgi:murein peptide amidase A